MPVLWNERRMAFYKESRRTSLSTLNFVARFPCPASGTNISTFNWRVVNASRKNVLAEFALRVTLGRPDFPPGPRYLMTEFVW